MKNTRYKKRSNKSTQSDSEITTQEGISDFLFLLRFSPPPPRPNHASCHFAETSKPTGSKAKTKNKEVDTRVGGDEGGGGGGGAGGGGKSGGAKKGGGGDARLEARLKDISKKIVSGGTLGKAYEALGLLDRLVSRVGLVVYFSGRGR